MLVSIEWHLLHFNFKIIYRFKKDARKDNKAIVSDCAKCIWRPMHSFFLCWMSSLTYVLLTLSSFSIVNTLFILCYQIVTTCDQSCRQCSWLSNISNMLIRTNCNNKVHSLNFSIVNLNWNLDFDKPCKQCSRLSNISNVLIRTNCNNNVHSLKFSIVNSNLILDCALQEASRSY